MDHSAPPLDSPHRQAPYGAAATSVGPHLQIPYRPMPRHSLDFPKLTPANIDGRQFQPSWDQSAAYSAHTSFAPQQQIPYHPSPLPPRGDPEGWSSPEIMVPNTAPWQTQPYGTTASAVAPMMGAINLGTREDTQARMGTVIEYSTENMERLRELVLSPEPLQSNGYLVKELTEAELERKKRCMYCDKGTKHHPSTSDRPTNSAVAVTKKHRRRRNIQHGIVRQQPSSNPAPAIEPGSQPTRQANLKCKYHTGNIVKDIF